MCPLGGSVTGVFVGRFDGVSIRRFDGVSIRRLCWFSGGASVWSDLLIQCTHPKHISYLRCLHTNTHSGEGREDKDAYSVKERKRYLVACVYAHKSIQHSSAVPGVHACWRALEALLEALLEAFWLWNHWHLCGQGFPLSWVAVSYWSTSCR